MKFSKLVEFVSKKPIPPHVKHLVVEVMVTDEEGEDVEVCFFLILDYLRSLTVWFRSLSLLSIFSGSRAKGQVLYQLN